MGKKELGLEIAMRHDPEGDMRHKDYCGVFPGCRYLGGSN